MCRKAGEKLSALLRLSPYLDTNKMRTICNSMVKSQLNYRPLVGCFAREGQITFLTKSKKERFV